MSFDFGKECNDFIGCQSESIKTHKPSVYKKEEELISYFLNEKEKDDQPKKLSKVINIIEDCIKLEHINFISASMTLLSRLTAPKDVKFHKKLTPPTVNNLLEFITSKIKNINCVKYILIILRHLYEEYPYIKTQIIPIVLKYFTGEETNLIAYGALTHNNALKIISNIINDIINKNIEFNDEQKNKFLLIIIDLIDETQDPRNLKLIFDFVPKLSLFIDKNILENHTKDIFECLIGFFPINFNAKDTRNVKKEEIVTEGELTNLLNNLLSQEIFNEYLFEEIDLDEYKNSSDLLLLYQSIIKNYSYELLSKYYTKIVGYILTTLENNNEEFLNIQCFITYKAFLEKYHPYDKNIEQTWNKLYDNIFSDNIKTMTVGKDMICPIITYDTQNIYIQKSIELFIKMISLYSFNLNKCMILKLSNSVIFFILNKKNINEYENKYISAFNVLKDNKKLLLNIIKEKKHYENNSINCDNNSNDSMTISNTNKFIIIADILTGIITKVQKLEIFEIEEKKEIFDIIYKYYINEFNIDIETEKDIDHLCILLVELSKNIEKNEDVFYDKIKEIFLLKNKKSYYLIKQIFKLSENITLKKRIISDMIKNIETNDDIKELLIDILSYEKNNIAKEELLNELNEQLEKIIINHIKDKTYNSFINGIINNMNISNVNKIAQFIINILISNKINDNNNSSSSFSDSKQLFFMLNNFIKILIKKQKEKKIIDVSTIENLYNNIKTLYLKLIEENIIKNNEKNNILICIKKLFKHCSFEFRAKVINEMISSKLKSDNNNKIYNDIKNEEYISSLINYIIKNYDSLINEKMICDSYDDLLITKIFNEINAMEPSNKKIFEKSKLFMAKNISEKLRNKLLINLKNYYSSINNDNNNFLNILMNIYNSLPLEEQNNYLDILFRLYIECINKKINPIQSIFNLRKIIININPKETLKYLNLIKIYPLCINIINIINDITFNENNQLIKIEGIKLIGVLSGFIQDEWETEDKKLVIYNLRKCFLNDKKRKVRYATGIILNILNCTSPMISLLNQ